MPKKKKPNSKSKKKRSNTNPTSTSNANFNHDTNPDPMAVGIVSEEDQPPPSPTSPMSTTSSFVMIQQPTSPPHPSKSLPPMEMEEVVENTCKDEMNKEVGALKSLNTALVKDIDRMRDEMQRIRTQMTDEVADCDRDQFAKLDASGIFSRLRLSTVERMSEMERKVRSLEEAEKKSQSEILSLKKKNESEFGRILEMEKTNEELKGEVVDLQKELESKSVEVLKAQVLSGSLKEHISSLEEDVRMNGDLKAEMGLLIREVEAKSAIVCEVEKMNEVMKSEFEAKFMDFEEEIKVLNEQLRVLKKRDEAKASQVTNLERKKKNLKDEIVILKSRDSNRSLIISDLEKKKAEIEMSAKRSMEEATNSAPLIAAMEAKNGELAEERATLLMEKEQTQKTIAELGDLVEFMTMDIAEKSKDIESLKFNLNCLLEEVAEKEATKENKEKSYEIAAKDASKRIKELRKNVKLIVKERDDLERANSAMSIDLRIKTEGNEQKQKSWNIAMDDLEWRVKELEKNTEIIVSERDNLELQRQDSEAEIGSLKEDVERLRTQTEKLIKKMKSEVEAKEVVKKKNENLQEQVQSLQDQNDWISDQLEKKEFIYDLANEEFSRRLGEFYREIQMIEKEKNEINKQYQLLQEQSKKLRTEAEEKEARLKIEIEAGKGELKKLRSEKDSQIALSQQQIDRLTSISREQAKDVLRMQEENSNGQRNVETQKEIMKGLKKQIKELHRTKDSTEHQFRMLKDVKVSDDVQLSIAKRDADNAERKMVDAVTHRERTISLMKNTVKFMKMIRSENESTDHSGQTEVNNAKKIPELKPFLLELESVKKMYKEICEELKKKENRYGKLVEVAVMEKKRGNFWASFTSIIGMVVALSIAIYAGKSKH